MREKPCAGYPSRTAAVLALSAEGKKPAEIEKLTGIKATVVTALRRNAFKRCIEFDEDVIEDLAPHAATRGITPTELARRIVLSVLEEDMVGAVLDDGITSEAEAMAHG
jgi:hypothetical protein